MYIHAAIATHTIDRPTLSKRALTLLDRNGRVIILLAVILVLSAYDLYMTLAMMTGPGMLEANPIAVWLAQRFDSPTAIGIYKAMSLIIGCGVLYRLRRFVSAEIGGWLITAVLVALSIQWVRYAAFIASLDAHTLQELSKMHNWIVLGCA